MDNEISPIQSVSSDRPVDHQERPPSISGLQQQQRPSPPTAIQLVLLSPQPVDPEAQDLEADENVPNPKTKPPERAYHVDWLRACAILMVVIFHATKTIPVPDGATVPDWLQERKTGFLKVMGTFGVFTFFLCAGRAQVFKRASFKDFVQNRAIRLLVPFLFAVPFCLQPGQYIACSNGYGLLGCTSAYHGPEMTYLEFMASWFDNIDLTIQNLGWLWFLPCLFITDVLNFGTQRTLTYFFEGGWHSDRRTPDELEEAGPMPPGGFEFLFERPDVARALSIQLLFQIITATLLDQIGKFWLLFWAVQVAQIWLIKRVRETKRYEFWFLARFLLPITTSVWCLYWIPGRLEFLLQNYAIFTLFTNHGYMLQLVEPFIEAKVTGAGGSTKPLLACIMFLILCLSIPTSGPVSNPSVPPLSTNDPAPLAMLGLAGSWLAITVVDFVFKTMLNAQCDRFQYHHITQFCTILYVVHMLFLVIMIAYANDKFFNTTSYPVRWLLDIGITIWCSALVYAILLSYETTRSIFSLKRIQMVGVVSDDPLLETPAPVAVTDISNAA